MSLAWGAGRLLLTSTGISLLVSESAYCFLMQEDFSGIQLYVLCVVVCMECSCMCMYIMTFTSHSPHRHPHLPTPQENFHYLEVLLSLAFLVQQVRWKLCPKYGRGNAGFLLSAVLAYYWCQSHIDINKPHLFIAFLNYTIYYQENAGHNSKIRNSFWD